MIPCPSSTALGEVRPALELGVRWLDLNRAPSGRRVTVHGDFRMGNLLVGKDGLRAVLDWELAHRGRPCRGHRLAVRPILAIRCRSPGRRVRELTDLLASYTGAGGEAVDTDRVRWWEVYAAVKWAVICALQAATHLSGASRSVELAAIGRRVCESEWDLFTLLGQTPDDTDDATAGLDPPPAPPAAVAPFGRPTSFELVEAAREHLDTRSDRDREGRTAFDDRIVRNVLHMVERELLLGPAISAAHAECLAGLGFTTDAALATAIRAGAYDDDMNGVGRALARSTRRSTTGGQSVVPGRARDVRPVPAVS